MADFCVFPHGIRKRIHRYRTDFKTHSNNIINATNAKLSAKGIPLGRILAGEDIHTIMRTNHQKTSKFLPNESETYIFAAACMGFLNGTSASWQPENN